MTNAVAFSWLNMLTTPLEPVKTTKDSAAKAPARAPRPMQKPIEFKRRARRGNDVAPGRKSIPPRLQNRTQNVRYYYGHRN